MKRFALLAGLLACAPCWGQSPWKYATDSPDFNVLVNTDRISTPYPGDHRFWVKVVPKLPAKTLPIDETDPKSKRYAEGMQFLRITCSDRQLASIQIHYYDHRQNIIQSFNGNEHSLRPIIPDSIGDGLHRFVCAPR